MQEIIKKAVELLRNKYTLPEKGFLAGGSLANTINKLKFGGKVVINDIDIFLIEKEEPLIINNPSDLYDKPLIKDTKSENFKTDYGFITTKTNIKNYIKIIECDRDKIFNFIKINQNFKDYQFIIDTFDINCCQVGYDLETNECYWTDDFKQYLEDKELKITYPCNPSHSVIRILKKRDELDAKLDLDNEMNFLILANLPRITGIRHWFSYKYKEIYEKYKDEISKYFILLNKEKIKDDNTYFSYRLYPKNWQVPEIFINSERRERAKNYTYLSAEFNLSLPNGEESRYFKKNININKFVYFYKNIFPDKRKLEIFKNLQNFYKNNNYIDGINLNKLYLFMNDIVELGELITCYPNIQYTFDDKTLIEHIKLKNWLKEILNDKKILYAILNKHQGKLWFDNKEDLENELLILKIKYRKEIYQTKKYNNGELHF